MTICNGQCRTLSVYVMREQDTNDRDDADLGFDGAATKAAFSHWIIEHSSTEGQLGMIVAAYRALRERNRGMAEMAESLALMLGATHSLRHEVSGITRDDDDRAELAWCPDRPCKIMAISRSLLALVQHDACRSGYRVQLLKSLKRVVEVLTSELPILKESVRAMQTYKPKGPAASEAANTAREVALAAAIRRGTGDPIEVVTSRLASSPLRDALEMPGADELNAVSSLDVLVAAVYGKQFERVVEGLEMFREFAANLCRDLREVGTHYARGAKRSGRPSHELLNRIRWCLRQGGFQLSELVWLVPDGPLETEDQQRQALDRVKKGIRAAAQLPRTWDAPP